VRYQTPLSQISRRDVPLASGSGAAGNPGMELAIRHRSAAAGRMTPAGRSHKPERPIRPFVERVPSAVPAALVPSAQAEWELSISQPPNSLAMWHQQMRMMELFHNDMIMMVQMFFAMHREHLASTRDELDRVEQLTRELAVLQARLAQPASPATGS